MLNCFFKRIFMQFHGLVAVFISRKIFILWYNQNHIMKSRGHKIRRICTQKLLFHLSGFSSGNRSFLYIALFC